MNRLGMNSSFSSTLYAERGELSLSFDVLWTVIFPGGNSQDLRCSKWHDLCSLLGLPYKGQPSSMFSVILSCMNRLNKKYETSQIMQSTSLLM